MGDYKVIGEAVDWEDSSEREEPKVERKNVGAQIPGNQSGYSPTGEELDC